MTEWMSQQAFEKGVLICVLQMTNPRLEKVKEFAKIL